PERGLYTAIVGGFVVSLLGGSRFQIGGPAGAFIVLIAATVARHGVDGLILATILSGFILMAVGFLRLGTFIKYIPFPVTVGFTSGIAVIIAASQLRDLFGLQLDGREPPEFLPKLEALFAAAGTVNWTALSLAAGAIVIIALLRCHRPNWPAYLIAVAGAAAAAAALALPVETIGARFGELPHAPPWPSLPPVTLERIAAVLPDAVAFALLGGIESLLSAVVADTMTGRRHRSNAELVAQGAANIASGLFGGIPVTGTIARTATNVRAGARGPVSGMLHAAFLLLFMLIAAPLASYIPLASLAAVLIMVAWNMAEKHEFATLVRASPGDAVVLLATFLLTIFYDLMTGIVVGFSLGALLFLHRLAEDVRVEHRLPDTLGDAPDTQAERYDAALAADPDIAVFRISGAFFFGAAASVAAALDRIAAQPRFYVIDFSAVPLLDSSAAATIASFARRAERRGARVVITGAQRSVLRVLLRHGVRRPHALFRATLEEGVAAAQRAISASVGSNR
ncbi:MAG: SulP family inorganic anion transporter, partial [Hyphomonadaceae bacterium]